jgi:hypothetical protein
MNFCMGRRPSGLVLQVTCGRYFTASVLFYLPRACNVPHPCNYLSTVLRLKFSMDLWCYFCLISTGHLEVENSVIHLVLAG